MSRSSSGRPDQQRGLRPFSAPMEQSFTCVRCGLPISCAPLVAGVLNRNHCPICLWSRHLDWRAAGDRRSNCRAPMEPVGLITKASRNRYAREPDGELMLIHRCAACGRLSLNRIAADDDADAILALLDRADALGELGDSVTPLSVVDRALVRRRLFGAGR